MMRKNILSNERLISTYNVEVIKILKKIKIHLGDFYKDKLYIIGSISQKEQIKKTAQYYINTGRYKVRYVKEEPNVSLPILIYKCFLNIIWADRIYAIPKPDGSLGTGVTYEMVFAKILGKWVDRFLTEEEFDCLFNKCR